MHGASVPAKPTATHSEPEPTADRYNDGNAVWWIGADLKDVGATLAVALLPRLPLDGDSALNALPIGQADYPSLARSAQYLIWLVKDRSYPPAGLANMRQV